MRGILIALGVASALFVPSPDPLVPSAAQAAVRASDDLLLKCRRSVFRRYGYRGPGGLLYLNKDFVVRQVDRCVASGGRVERLTPWEQGRS